MKKTTLTTALLFCTLGLSAQGISQEMLTRFAQTQKLSGSERAIKNALAAGPVSALALNQDNQVEQDTYFSNSVPSKGITDQKSSGRCWLFTGMNMLRAQMIKDQHLPQGIEFSQNYLFFYDQLEKANLFLQAIIDTRKKPMEDQTVMWLFQNPLSDGGTFTGVADLVTKYGIVPKGVMPENYTSNNTSQFTTFLKRKLREDALMLRVDSKATDKTLQAQKEKFLSEIYHMLALGLGTPVTEFTWAPKDSDGKTVYPPKKYTPQDFYKEFLGQDLQNDYLMLMNDPTREYWKTYEIQYDRHTYDGHNWLYLNIPMEDIKEAAIASIKDSTMMYFSCDVSKFLDRTRGIADLANYDYDAIFGVHFGMDKAQRIKSFDSGSTHAMTLKAVDLDENGKPLKWEVENSWGANYGHQGHIIMTDEWFDNYMFRLVINKKYASEKILKASQQKPTLLPCWDPMFSSEE
ncbi:MAG: C1 family peptidase [Bacteroidaceae bacterium]|nr:C1 family peptidase [Bacteroidaceae bacterium]